MPTEKVCEKVSSGLGTLEISLLMSGFQYSHTKKTLDSKTASSLIWKEFANVSFVPPHIENSSGKSYSILSETKNCVYIQNDTKDEH